MTSREAQHLEAPPAGPWAALVALPFVALTVPAALVLSGPLQSNGWPPRLLIFWIAGAVVLGWLVRHPRPGPRITPAEVGAWLFLMGVVASFAATGLRTLTEEESAGALRFALVLMPLVVVTVAIAATANRRQVDLLLMAVVFGVGVSALVALTQQVAPFNLAEVIRPPGMVAREIGGFGTRSDFTRVKGAADHPIEFGVIGGAVLPLCLHYVRFGRTHRLRVASTISLVLLAMAVPLTMSRSGVVAVAVAGVVYAAVLTNRQRANLVVLAVVGAVLARAAVPGLLGGLAGIFQHIGTDDSVSARVDDYEHVAQFFAESPLVGHGLGTFRPEVYFYLDNQYLMSLIEGGLVLVLTTIIFFALAMASARGARRRAQTEKGASQAQAVLGGIAAVAVSGAFFDLFSFAQVTVLVFVLAGVAGAMWRHSLHDGRRLPTVRERLLLPPESLKV